MDGISYLKVEKPSAAGDYDYLIKILALGDSNVGKTSLLYHYTENKRIPKTGPTLGLDFFEKRVVRELKADWDSFLGPQQCIHLQLWDTAGQEKYRSICTTFIRDAMGFLLVMDLTNEQSLLHCREWLSLMMKHAYTSRPDVVLVGNKSDLTRKRTVSLKMAEQMAAEMEVPYIETSALNGENVDLAFHTLLELVMQRVEDSVDKMSVGSSRSRRPDSVSKGKASRATSISLHQTPTNKSTSAPNKGTKSETPATDSTDKADGEKKCAC